MPTLKPEPKPSFNEAFNNLTGYNEAEIEKRFGFDVYVRMLEMADPETGELKTIPRLMQRAVIFGNECRKGVPVEEAYTAAMELPSGEIDDYFSHEEDPAEDLGQPADTEAGKGDSTSK